MPKPFLFCLGTLGAAQLASGEPARAAETLESAIPRHRDERVAALDRLLLAMARWRLGEKDEARETLRAATTWIDAQEKPDVEAARLRAEAEALIRGD